MGRDTADEAGDDGHAASMAEASDPCRGVIRFKARKLAGMNHSLTTA